MFVMHNNKKVMAINRLNLVVKTNAKTLIQIYSMRM